MGYLIERTQVSMKGGDGQVATQSFRGVTIWRRQPDGSWKNVVDISNRAAPPGAAQP
jgi:ketosteroid isomerase-like protein